MACSSLVTEVEIIFNRLGTVIYAVKMAAKTRDIRPLSKPFFQIIDALNDDIFCAVTGNVLQISCLSTT